MVKLFVDCDDTLVFYQDGSTSPHPYGTYMGTPFVVNAQLVEGIREFRRDDPWAVIVIWSGGGKEYAEMWARRLELDHLAIGMCKDKVAYDLIQPGDIVVDDDPDVPRTHGPYEWPERTRIIVPWSQEQVQILNRQQRDYRFHGYTCPNQGNSNHPTAGFANIAFSLSHFLLIATIEGWRCPTCDYTQNWAHTLEGV